MSEETIGALAVRVSADVGDFVKNLGKANKETTGFASAVKIGHNALIAFSAVALAAEATMIAIAKSAANAQDEIGKLSQKVGVSVESLSAFKYAAELSDVSVEELGKGLKFLAKGMVEAQQGTGDAREAFLALGLQVQESSGALKTSESMLLEIAERFSKIEDGAGKTALAIKIFGRSGAELIPFLNQGRAGLEELRAEAEKLGIVFSTKAAKQAEEFNDNLKRLKASAEGTKIAFGNELIPTLNEFAQQALDGIRISGGLGKALMELAGINPFRELGSNIIALTGDLGEMKKARDDFKNMEGYEEQVKQLDNTIRATEHRIEFLKAMQQREAMKLAGEGSMDTRDIRGQKPAAAKEKAPPIIKPISDDQMRAIAEGEEEFRKEQQEAMAAYARFMTQVQKDTTHELVIDQKGRITAVNEVTREGIAVDQKMQAERNKALIDSYDAEQERAIELGAAIIAADGEAHTMKLLKLAESIGTAEQIEIDAHREKMKRLKDFTDEELEALGGRNKVIEDMDSEHKKRLTRLTGKHYELNEDSAKTFFGNIAVLMNTNSERMFKIGKQAAIAETIINTYKAAMGAYSALAPIPYVGPFLGAAAAAAAVAFGMAQVQQIRAQSFNGGGGAAPVAAASPTTGLPTGTPGGDVGSSGGARQQPQRIFNIQVSGSARSVFEEFANGMNALADEGFKFRVQS